ncbi:MAG: hypothetical protein DRN30_05385 [Thermoplasmata archaeon]|nr:MAG: hypothetical protein DRN30_05385 [Thermoplasmata archaeon]
MRSASYTMSIDVRDVYDGIYSRNVDKILERALVAAGIPTERTVMQSWTDALNLAEIGCDVVVWGPGELYRCHTEKERVSIEEIIKAKKALVALNDILEAI